MNIKDIRELSASDLTKVLKEQKEELFNLRFQHSINQLDNPMKIVETKKTIARVLTVLHEKEQQSNKA
ncbi:50S ribosomal protein L29 [Eubacteriales bacterium OttesenSCG-928-G02]|nr:50S ribosomal protein L29 [Eubacteriales bacterium OttesenSCG-928-G02]